MRQMIKIQHKVRRVGPFVLYLLKSFFFVFDLPMLYTSQVEMNEVLLSGRLTRFQKP